MCMWDRERKEITNPINELIKQFETQNGIWDMELLNHLVNPPSISSFCNVLIPKYAYIAKKKKYAYVHETGFKLGMVSHLLNLLTGL